MTETIRFKGISENEDLELSTKIVKAIQECPGMISLHLEECKISRATVEAIGNALKTQSNLKRLLFKGMRYFTDETQISTAFGCLCNGLMTAQANITVLDLSDNFFTSNEMVGLIDFFKSPYCYNLRELYLNLNFLHDGMEELSDYICRSIENSIAAGRPMVLKILECAHCGLMSEGIAHLSKFLVRLGSLRSINLVRNSIGPDGARTLSSIFLSNPLLREITLGENNLSGPGINCLANCLPSLHKLEILNLSECGIVLADVITLSLALRNSCPKLRRLDLSFNEGIDGGFDQLLDALRNKKFLQDVYMCGCMFSLEAGAVFYTKLFLIKKDLGVKSSDEDTDSSSSIEVISDEECRSMMQLP